MCTLDLGWQTGGLLLWLREGLGYRQIPDVGLVDIDLFKRLPGKGFRWSGWFVLVSAMPNRLLNLENGFELAVTQEDRSSCFDPRLAIAYLKDCKRTAWTIENLIARSSEEAELVLLRQRFSGTVELLLEP